MSKMQDAELGQDQGFPAAAFASLSKNFVNQPLTVETPI
jgi:hypothetical protein